jgi:hypothetical protein
MHPGQGPLLASTDPPVLKLGTQPSRAMLGRICMRPGRGWSDCPDLAKRGDTKRVKEHPLTDIPAARGLGPRGEVMSLASLVQFVVGYGVNLRRWRGDDGL